MKGNTLAGFHPDLIGSEGSVVVSSLSDVSDIEEYSYGPTHAHLDEADALALYRKTMRWKTVDGLVVLQDHDCGHWTVVEYRTPIEREGYLRSLLARYAEIFSRLRPK